MQRELVSRRRCMCCGGVIDGLADDEAIEFDARIGLFTDEVRIRLQQLHRKPDRGAAQTGNSAAEVARR
jgi:hypothetical protein